MVPKSQLTVWSFPHKTFWLSQHVQSNTSGLVRLYNGLLVSKWLFARSQSAALKDNISSEVLSPYRHNSNPKMSEAHTLDTDRTCTCSLIHTHTHTNTHRHTWIAHRKIDTCCLFVVHCVVCFVSLLQREFKSHVSQLLMHCPCTFCTYMLLQH